MITDIQALQRLVQGLHQARMSVSKAVSPAVKVKIHKLLAVHVPEPVLLAAADYQIDAQLVEGLDPAGNQVLVGLTQDLLFFGRGAGRQLKVTHLNTPIIVIALMTVSRYGAPGGALQDP
ncbi:MAG: hypothetical protein V7731_23215 [Amphritea sp.]